MMRSALPTKGVCVCFSTGHGLCMWCLTRLSCCLLPCTAPSPHIDYPHLCFTIPSSFHSLPLHSRSASSLFTPSYAPTSNIIDKLRGLSDNLDSSSTQLQRLLDLLPAQLAQLKASAARLHRTAFPPGQPPHGGADAQASSSSSAAASTAGGGGSVGGGSTWGGSQSAAASTRSMHSVHSTGSGGGGDAVSVAAARHPALLLTLPEVADATAALKGCWDQLQVEANRAINKQNETVKAMHRHNKECQALERTCMAKFFTAPEQLAADVDGLKAKVQQLQISQALSF